MLETHKNFIMNRDTSDSVKQVVNPKKVNEKIYFDVITLDDCKPLNKLKVNLRKIKCECSRKFYFLTS